MTVIKYPSQLELERFENSLTNLDIIFHRLKQSVYDKETSIIVHVLDINITDEERKILLDLGYNISGLFGDSNPYYMIYR